MDSLWGEIARWWSSLWADPKIFGAAVGGLLTGLVLFLLNEAWRHRSAKDKLRRDLAQSRLDEVYGPLYMFYREAYARFEAWKRENPGSRIERQAFFSEERNETFVKEILATKPSHATQALIVRWAALQAAATREEQQRERASFIKILIHEYQGLRRELELDFDKRELRSGEFSE